jgi:hypothetical protein
VQGKAAQYAGQVLAAANAQVELQSSATPDQRIVVVTKGRWALESIRKGGWRNAPGAR